VKKNVVVTISSDKGLCGGINSTSVKISKAWHKLNSGISWKLIAYLCCHQKIGCYLKSNTYLLPQVLTKKQNMLFWEKRQRPN
jgi:F0F1-type ATP synthase gamma subunit